MRVHMAAHKIILAIALTALLPSVAFAMTPGQVYEAVKDSVVVVKVGDQQGRQVGSGSGVMLPSGDIITNYHVVKNAAMYTVGRGRQYRLATLKGVDEEKDLCLLTAPGLVAEPARLGKAARLKVGDPVYAVGAPQGLELSLSEGIISQLRGGDPPIIQTTVAISPGSSGGGLFNAKGELVGITTFYMKEGQSLNFAVPVEWVGQIKWVIVSVEPSPSTPPKANKAPTAPVPDWEDRGRPPVKTRFTKAQNGVITDSATGLEWYVGPARDTTWHYAKSWTEHLKEAGGGWRMPTIPELNTLYQKGENIFSNMEPIFQTNYCWRVWSGQLKNFSTAYCFDFQSGREDWNSQDYSAPGYRAFAVRSR